MVRVRKKSVLVVMVALVIALLAVTPVLAATVPDEEVIEDPIVACRFDGMMKITFTNTFYAGDYFVICTTNDACAELGQLDWGEQAHATLPYSNCVEFQQCKDSTLEACQGGRICINGDWPACPVDTGTCEGGAGLYPPSNNGVPYNGYNDAGYFLLVVDTHCGQSAEWVDVFTGDPLTELTQVMSLWVGPNGWTQFSQDDIQNIRDMYDYSGEIWFRVHGIGDRYYGLHELMTHPNLGSE